MLEEIKVLADRQQHVKLVYEKIIENIRILCRIPESENKILKEDNSLLHNTSGYVAINNSSQLLNLNDSRSLGEILAQNMTDTNHFMSEDEIVRVYNDFLDTIKISLNDLVLKITNDEFLHLMKEKGSEPNTTTNAGSRNKKDKDKNKVKRNSLKDISSPEKFSPIRRAEAFIDKTVNNFSVQNNNNNTTAVANAEYDYSDSECLEEDGKIKRDNDQLIKEYKAIVILKFLT